MPTEFGKIWEAADAIRQQLGDFVPEVGLVLGSGLGYFAEEKIKDPIRIPYGKVPHFPQSTAPGHAGQFVFGMVGGRRVVAMQGRVHFYEGVTMRDVVLPIRVMKVLGIHSIILTNAAGGICEELEPGDLMLVRDHINFMGDNPLRGFNDARVGQRFPDMTMAYDEALRAKAQKVADGLGYPLKEGVYLAVSGPSFETPAEIRAFRLMGADAVGMSTVPEVIAARHCGLKVCAISCISNKAAGLGMGPLSAEEVLVTAHEARHLFCELVTGLVE